MMKQDIYTIGIDVGAKGSLCVLKNKKIHKLIVFKNVKSYVEEIKKARDEYSKHRLAIYVEKVHSMHRQGVKSMFSFGQRLGEIIGMLETLDVSYNLVTPKEWQKILFMKYNCKKKEDVKLSIGEFIYNIFKKDVNLLKRTGKINTDLTDSIAIAYTYSEF